MEFQKVFKILQDNKNKNIINENKKKFQDIINKENKVKFPIFQNLIW